MALDPPPSQIDAGSAEGDGSRVRDASLNRRVFLWTVLNYGGKLCTLGTWFLLTPFMLQKLGPTEYGLWVLVSAVVAYSSLLDLGIGSAVTKYVAEHGARGSLDQVRGIVATSVLLYAGLGLLAFAACALLAPILPHLLQVSADLEPLATQMTLVLGLSVGLAMPMTTAGAVLRGLQRYGVLNAMAVVQALLTAAATVAVLLVGGGLLLMTISHVIVTLCVQLVQVAVMHHIAPTLRPRLSDAQRTFIRPISTYTAPLFVTQLAGQLQSRSDGLVIGLMLPVSAVTPYAIALKLSETPQILTDQFMRVLMPLASEFDAQRDTNRLRVLFTTATRLTLMISLPISLMMVFLGDWLLSAWVGAEYAVYAYLVTILTIAILIDTLNWPAALILQGMGCHHRLAPIAIGSGLANVVLSLLLVGPFGLAGVAMGTLIPTVIETTAFVIPYAMRTIGVRPLELLKDVLLPVVAPGVMMVIVLTVLRHYVSATTLLEIGSVGGVAGMIYLGTYLAIGARGAERALVISAVARVRQVFRPGTATA